MTIYSSEEFQINYTGFKFPLKDKRVTKYLIGVTALVAIVGVTPVLSNFAMAQLLPKRLVLVIEVDCPVVVVHCFSHHALAKILSGTPHDPEAVGVCNHSGKCVAAYVISFAPSGITDFTVSLPPPVHGLAVDLIIPSTVGPHTNDCRKSGGSEVTGTLLPFSVAVCGVTMDVHPLHEGGSNANGGNANGGNGGNANGGNSNSGDEDDNSG